MTYTITGVFRPDLGTSADGLTVEAYAVSSWSGTPPALGTTPPGSPDVSGTTSTDNGDHGAWELPLSTNEDYFVVVEYDSSYYWQRCNVPTWTDGVAGELDVTSSTIGSATISSATMSAATINSKSVYGLDDSGLSVDVVGISTENVNSLSSGSIALGAFVDHQHEGLGASLLIVSGSPSPAATRYVGATTGAEPGVATPGNSYAPGDFAIDQTGEVWVYTAASTWVSIASGPAAGVTGTIAAYAGIGAPDGWFACDGSPIGRVGFSSLFGALTVSFTGNTHATGTLVDGISDSVTSLLQPGWPIEGAGIASGTTIASVASGSIELSLAASSDGAAVDLLAAPWGIGDGSTTFNVPDLRGRVPVGSAGSGSNAQPYVALGGSGWALSSTGPFTEGEAAHVLDIAELAAHNHDHAHGGATGGENQTHNHAAASGANGFLANGSGAIGYGGGSYGLGWWGTTGAETGAHSHDIPADATATGSGVGHNNMPPLAGVNWIIKW